MEFWVYNTPLTADWLAHATQEDTHRFHTGWYSMYRYSSRAPSREALELLSLSPHSPPPSRPCLLEMKSCSRQYILIIWQLSVWIKVASPKGWVLLIFLCFLVNLHFLVKKKENKHITVLKYCLTYSVSLCSVCAQDWAELTSASFLLRVRAGEPASVSLQCACLHLSLCSLLPPASPLLLLSLEGSLADESTSKKNILPSPPTPQSPSVPACHSQPIKKYELVFLL